MRIGDRVSNKCVVGIGGKFVGSGCGNPTCAGRNDTPSNLDKVVNVPCDGTVKLSDNECEFRVPCLHTRPATVTVGITRSFLTPITLLQTIARLGTARSTAEATAAVLSHSCRQRTLGWKGGARRASFPRRKRSLRGHGRSSFDVSDVSVEGNFHIPLPHE